MQLSSSNRFIERQEDFYEELLEFMGLWKNYAFAHRESQFLDDVKKFYPYIPFELQDNNMYMDIPKRFWPLDLTMGTKFFNELHIQRKGPSIDLRAFIEYPYYVEGPCFLVHYELEKFRNFYLNNRLLKLNIKGTKLPLEILSYLSYLFYMDKAANNALLAARYKTSYF